MSALLELVIHVNNSRWPHALLYLAARLTTVSLDIYIYIYMYISRLTVVSREAKEEVPYSGFYMRLNILAKLKLHDTKYCETAHSQY